MIVAASMTTEKGHVLMTGTIASVQRPLSSMVEIAIAPNV
jgi:hypothetical protein